MRQIGKENINSKEWWEEFFKQDRFQKRHSWRQEPYRLISKYVDFTKINNWKVYDFGCAFGDGLHWLWSINKDNKYIGTDFSEEAIVWAKQHYEKKGLEFFVDDIYKTKIKDADMIIIAETLEHLEGDMKIVEKLRKMCKVLIITVPYRELEKNKGKDIHEAHVNHYDDDSFEGAKKFIENYMVVVYGYENLPK